MALEDVIGKYVVEFFGDTAGLKGDLSKLELQATKSATAMEKSFASGFQSGVAKARESTANLTEFVGSAVGRVAGFLTNPMTALVAIGTTASLVMADAIKDAVEYDRAFNRVRVALAGTGEDIDKLKTRLLDLTPSMASSGEEAAGLANVLAVGFKSDDALKVLDTAAKLSRVTGVDLNTAAELLTQTLNTYNLTAEDSARVSDAFLQVFRTAGGPEAVQELAGSLSRVLPLAAELKIPVEQVAAALATMRTQGIGAGRGAQALGAILGKVTSDAQRFRDANIDIYAVAQTQGLPGVLDAIKRVAGGSIEDMKDLGIQTRILQATLALTGENAGDFADNLAKMGQVKLDDMVKNAQDITNSMIDLRDGWEDFKIAIGTWAIPALAAITKAAANAVNEVTGQKGPATFPTDEEIAAELEKAQLVGAGEQAVEGVAGGGARGGAAVGYGRSLAVTKNPEEARRLSNAERARMRENLAGQNQIQSEYLKSFEAAQLQEISLSKQTAQERKASELELLQFDQQSTQTKFDWEERIRAARIATIDQMLPLLKTENAEEKKQYETLVAERVRLERQGVTDRQELERQMTLFALKENSARIKQEEALFAVRKTRGELSLQDEVDYWNRRAAMFAQGTNERMQAEAEAYKAAKDMADKLFEHERTLGIRSLRDEIDRLKQKAAEAKAGSAEQMKAQEDLYKKQQELRDKSRPAALKMLDEVQARLEEKGYTEVTAADVQRELADLNRERGQQAMETGRWANGNQTMSFEDIRKGYEAGGRLEEWNRTQQELGSPGEILSRGATVGVGPVTEGLGLATSDQTLKDLYAAGRPDLAGKLLGRMGPEGNMLGEGYWQSATEPIGDGYANAFDKALMSVDAGLTKIEERVNESSSRIATTIYNNMEEWFVRKLMFQAERG